MPPRLSSELKLPVAPVPYPTQLLRSGEAGDGCRQARQGYCHRFFCFVLQVAFFTILARTASGARRVELRTLRRALPIRLQPRWNGCCRGCVGSMIDGSPFAVGHRASH
jgi:hypothetical protein